MGEDYIERVTWDEVGAYLNAVTERVDPHDCSGVFGIPRGGLSLAAWLSHKIYLPLLFAPAPNCIIIDDICDSGETLLHYVKNSSNPEAENNYFITTMFYRENDLEIKPDHYWKLKGDSWIVFPWEE